MDRNLGTIYCSYDDHDLKYPHSPGRLILIPSAFEERWIHEIFILPDIYLLSLSYTIVGYVAKVQKSSLVVHIGRISRSYLHYIGCTATATTCADSSPCLRDCWHPCAPHFLDNPQIWKDNPLLRTDNRWLCEQLSSIQASKPYSLHWCTTQHVLDKWMLRAQTYLHAWQQHRRDHGYKRAVIPFPTAAELAAMQLLHEGDDEGQGQGQASASAVAEEDDDDSGSDEEHEVAYLRSLKRQRTK